MLVRYSKDEKGRAVRSAEIYTKEEHGIKLEDIDPDAIFVCRKLKAAGYEAYIVGGAVRDLLLGKKPKDFDIATSAQPRFVKKVLPRSRIIGKRFRLVHAVFHYNKILEIATFRSDIAGDANVFGTLEEDVRRRDFTCNALFYDPKEEQVIDHVGGVKDIRQKKLRNVIDLETIFTDDPVRMIRAVKYAALSRFSLGWSLGWKIKSQAKLLAQISPSRLTEEFYKILFSGQSYDLIETLNKNGLLKFFVPALDEALGKVRSALKRALPVLDRAAKLGEDEQALQRPEAFFLLLEPIMESLNMGTTASTQNFMENILWIKNFFKPIVPSNRECEESLRALYKKWAVRAPRPKLPRTAHPSGPVPSELVDVADGLVKKRRRRRRPRKKPEQGPNPNQD